MGRKANLSGLLCLLMGVSACGSSSLFETDSKHINNKVKFSSSAYGVAASPRVTTSRRVRKGGGRRQIGKPYQIKGKWYTPREDLGYDRTGQASWYGPNFHGRLTANGEIYDQYAITAAHPTFPLPSYARVTNLANGRSLVVRVNDRGPYHEGRIIDLSAKASDMLGYQHLGVAQVRVEYIKQAPLHGLDHKMLASSFKTEPGGGLAAIDVASRIERQRRRPAIIRLSDLTTGSVSSDAAHQDPFRDELEAVGAKRDTGSTLALRLKKFLKANKLAQKH
jgi:rare lipoprotein A